MRLIYLLAKGLMIRLASQNFLWRVAITSIRQSQTLRQMKNSTKCSVCLKGQKSKICQFLLLGGIMILTLIGHMSSSWIWSRNNGSCHPSTIQNWFHQVLTMSWWGCFSSTRSWCSVPTIQPSNSCTRLSKTTSLFILGRLHVPTRNGSHGVTPSTSGFSKP